jgi:hypothetical protein
MYSYTLFLTSALGRGGWTAPYPGHFIPGKTWYSLYRRLCGPQSQSGCVQKISPPPRVDLQTIQTVVSRDSSESLYLLHYPGPPPRLDSFIIQKTDAKKLVQNIHVINYIFLHFDCVLMSYGLCPSGPLLNF